MQITPQKWLAAFIGAALLHGIAMLIIFWQPPTSGAKAPGITGIEVSLGAAGSTPSSETETVDEISETDVVEATEAAITDPVIEEAVVTEVLPEAIQPEEVAAIEPPTPEPAPIVEQEIIEPVLAKPTTPVRKSIAKEIVAPTQHAPAKPVNNVSTVTAALPKPSTQGTSDKPDNITGNSKGEGNNTAGGGTPGQRANYNTIIQAWLEKHKKYPRRARKRRMEGVGTLFFEIDQEGNVLEYRIEKSTGFRLLDKELEAIIKRAEPLPQIPEELQQAKYEFSVPIDFSLGN